MDKFKYTDHWIVRYMLYSKLQALLHDILSWSKDYKCIYNLCLEGGAGKRSWECVSIGAEWLRFNINA